MLLQGNFQSKYIKHIVLLIAVLVVIVFAMGILLSRQQASYSNLALMDILKVFSNSSLEPPQECLDKPDG